MERLNKGILTVTFFVVIFMLGISTGWARQHNNHDKLPIELQKKLLTRQFDAAIPQLKHLSDAGSEEASYQLALIYLKLPTKKQNLSSILSLLRRAAKKGHTKANYLLGSMYFSGKDIDKDITSAKFYLFTAAQKGHQLAKSLLRKLDSKSQVVKMDNQKAQLMLDYAAVSGDISKAEAALQNGVNINKKNANGSTPLAVAIRSEQQKMALWLIQQGASTEFLNKNNDSALHLAVLHTMTDLVNALINKGVDVNSQNKQGRTPLMLAIKTKNNSLIKRLLNQGADVTIKDKKGLNSLDIVDNLSNKKIAALIKPFRKNTSKHTALQPRLKLLKKQVNSAGSLYYHWPLLAAAISQHDWDLANLLLKQGANPWEKNPGGSNSIVLAIESKNKLLATTLLKKFPLNSKSRINQSVRLLQLAAKNNNVGIVDLLMDTVPKKNLMALPLDKTPLWLSIVNKNQEVSLKFIQAQLANFKRNNNGINYILLASKYGLPQVVLTLIHKGFDVNSVDDLNRSALWYAADMGNKSLVELLLANGSIVDAKDNRQQTPLFRAIIHDHLDTVALLLKHHASLKVKSKTGNTPLMVAAAGHKKVLQLLLSRNDDLNVSNRNHASETALMIAIKSNCKNCVSLLMRHGANPNRKNALGQNGFDLAGKNEDILNLLKG
ncbi:MAG TPA: hypothetical protein ENJ60_05625 [Aeromonadales bacterium]|nr:hypothetical protein [Aeromonadales bacterium]